MAQFSPEGQSHGKEKPMPASANPDIARKIRNAMVTQDSAALSAWGQRGAEKTNEIRANKAEAKNYFKEKEAVGDQALRESTNEHIVPIESEQ